MAFAASYAALAAARASAPLREGIQDAFIAKSHPMMVKTWKSYAVSAARPARGAAERAGARGGVGRGGGPRAPAVAAAPPARPRAA